MSTGRAVIEVSERVTVLSDAIAEAIRAARKREGATRAEFAAAAWEAGAPASLTAAVVGYIETGRRDKDGRRRREVSVDELVWLASAADTTPLGLLGELAPMLGGDEPPACPRCEGKQGPVELAVRDDVGKLGPLEGTEPSLAATAYALAAGVDGQGAEEGRQVAALAKELRATLKAIEDGRARRNVPNDEDDELGGLGDPD
ncbi:hypothetical protein [Prauserella flavalba]|uniref:hypothetical protein n=1 Tax=Prauserella flavalba TaxID=1477506 RepID=UPI0036E63E9E